MPAPCHVPTPARRPRVPGGRLAVLALLAVLPGCGGDGDAPTEPGPSPAIGVSISPSSLDVAAGEAGTATVTVTRSGGFDGAVSLTLEGAPGGVSGSFDPASVSGGTTSSTLSLATTGAAAAGNAVMTIRASGQGVTARTAPLTLRVTAPEPTGGFSLAVSPASLGVQAGQSGTAAVRVTRTGGFTGAVALSVADLPSDLTATVEPASVAGDSATITLTAASGAATGTHALSVRGTADGLPDQSATLSAEVTPAPSGDVTWTFCASAGPLWMAYQDGDGPWTELPVSAGSTVTVPISTRGGIAFVHRGLGPVEVYALAVYYGTATELGYYQNWCAVQGAGKSVSGSVAGLGAGESATVSMGGTGAFVLAPESNFVLPGVPDGPRDLVAARGTAAGADRIIIRRGLTPAGGSTLPVLDFGGSEAFDPVARRVTIENLGPDQATTTALFTTATRTAGILGSSAEGPGTVRDFAGVPAPRLRADDFHSVLVSANAGVGGDDPTRVSGRLALVYHHEAMDHTVRLGPTPALPSTSVVSSSPYLRVRAEVARQAEYDDQVSLSVSTGLRVASVLATATYFGGAPATWSVEIPDLTAAGFDPAWGPQSGQPLSLWTWFAAGWDGVPVGATELVEGTVVRTGLRGGAIGG